MSSSQCQNTKPNRGDYGSESEYSRGPNLKRNKVRTPGEDIKLTTDDMSMDFIDYKYE